MGSCHLITTWWVTSGYISTSTSERILSDMFEDSFTDSADSDSHSSGPFPVLTATVKKEVQLKDGSLWVWWVHETLKEAVSVDTKAKIWVWKEFGWVMNGLVGLKSVWSHWWYLTSPAIPGQKQNCWDSESCWGTKPDKDSLCRGTWVKGIWRILVHLPGGEHWGNQEVKLNLHVVFMDRSFRCSQCVD